MNFIKTAFVLLSVLHTTLVFAQETAPDPRINEIYALMSDMEEARALANKVYKDLEKQDATISTYTSCLMLAAVYESVFSEAEIAAELKQKAAVVLTEYTANISAAYGSGSGGDEWNSDIFPKLFTSTDPQLAHRAVKYVKAHPELINYNNYAYIGYAFDRSEDNANAKKYYELALTFRDNIENEVYPLTYYIGFLGKTGDYHGVEQMVHELEKLCRITTSYVLSSYRIELLNARTIYYRFTGDFTNYIKSSEKMYHYMDSITAPNELLCETSNMSQLMITAYAYESLKQLDLAETKWKARDEAYGNWITCTVEKFPDHPQPALAMMPLYLAKVGRLEELARPLNDYMSEYDHYFEVSSTYGGKELRSFQGTILGFLNDQRYQSFYRQFLEEITDSKDFTYATKPFSEFAWFCSRDRAFDLADDTYRKLFEMDLEWLNTLISTFGEKSFVSYFNLHLKEGYDNYHSYVKILKDNKQINYKKHAGIDYNNILLTKSIAFRGTQKKKKLFLSSNDDSVSALYMLWIEKKRELVNYYLKAEREKREAIVAATSSIDLVAAQEEVDQMENQLANGSKDFNQLLKMEVPDWKKVRNNLKENEAAIEMIRFTWRDQVYYSDSSYYAAYIIKKESEYPEIVYLSESAEDLEQKFYSGYQNSIKLKVEDKRSYGAFWKEIGEQLEGKQRVYFSPDGIFHLINLPTLKNPETSKYLLDELEVHYVTSTSSLLKGAVVGGVSNSVLMGRPTYNLDAQEIKTTNDTIKTRSFVANFRGAGVADLPGTEEEILTIHRVMEQEGINVDFHLGANASEEELYALHSPDVLHIATHGYWSQPEGEVTPGYRMFNAMINSGLLLAGVVNYYTEDEHPYAHDGILTAYEAQSLDLENTQLVVLSACETGLGHFDAGEGVYGLQRAFRAAGARSVMTSLWKVDDAATKDFMIAFYHKYIQSQDKFLAFRTAQMAIKEKYEDPYYWGAFVLSGI